jgi:hypothetical protein
VSLYAVITSGLWGAPVERQDAARLARCRGGHIGPFHDDDIDTAATREIAVQAAIMPPPHSHRSGSCHL